MKRRANGTQKILLVCELTNLDIDLGSENAAEDSIVGRDKVLFHGECEQGPAFAADPGVHHGDMNRAWPEVARGRVQQIRGDPDVVRRNFVAEVHYLGEWVDAEDNPLHAAHEHVGGAEVG